MRTALIKRISRGNLTVFPECFLNVSRASLQSVPKQFALLSHNHPPLGAINRDVSLCGVTLIGVRHSHESNGD